MSESSNPTLAIAEYVHRFSFDDLPRAAIVNAKLIILDTIGVMFAGSRHEVGRLIADYVRANCATGVATVCGAGFQTSPELAALANGTMAHVHDYDSDLHIPTHTLSAALALAEACGAPGRTLILAYVVGREVCKRLEECAEAFHAGPQSRNRGWHTVGVTGSIGATAAAAKVLGLEPKALCRAFGIGASLSAGLWANRGTMTKPLHGGNAARNGVVAASLASKGFTADETIFSAAGGFCSLYDLPAERVALAVKKLREEVDIAKPVAFKRYPCVSPAHRYIETMRLMRSRYGLTADRVESIECTPSKSLRCPYPKTDLESKFSADFSLVATLIDGEVNLNNSTNAFLNRSDVQSLMARTVYVEKPPGYEANHADGFVRVKTKSGEVYQEDITRDKGELTTYEEVQAKFYACAAPVIGEAQAREIDSLIRELETVKSVSALVGLLRRADQASASARI
ncbi:MAG TPA: MmgE/PrpD family protein [Candidatus Acidoferrales bacterium]|nr:MmgE/PrpD family protein [Candidatus Acidoferrales bacterium]